MQFNNLKPHTQVNLQEMYDLNNSSSALSAYVFDEKQHTIDGIVRR